MRIIGCFDQLITTAGISLSVDIVKFGSLPYLSYHAVGVAQEEQVECLLLVVGCVHGQVLQVDVLVRVLHQRHLPAGDRVDVHH